MPFPLPQSNKSGSQLPSLDGCPIMQMLHYSFFPCNYKMSYLDIELLNKNRQKYTYQTEFPFIPRLVSEFLLLKWSFVHHRSFEDFKTSQLQPFIFTELQWSRIIHNLEVKGRKSKIFYILAHTHTHIKKVIQNRV